MSKYKSIDLSKLHKYSVKDRNSKVSVKDFVDPASINSNSILEKMPDFLKANELKELISHCQNAIANHKPIIVALGGHVIKVGLAPILIDLIKKGFISALASNGSVVIHDYELARFGKTSEYVADSLENGTFGMVSETCDGINNVIKAAYTEKLGYGEAIGKELQNSQFKRFSLLANAYKKDIPFSVMIALGTDINHQHETADGAAIGACSMRDFRIFCEQLKELNDGGVFLNFGSAVVMPEVFLKALTVVRNLGYEVNNFYTAVFDMNMHYRPKANIVDRPTKSGGKGYYFVGHHEILIPLFYHLLLEEL